MYALGGAFGLLALRVSSMTSWLAAVVAAVAAFLALVAVAVLERAPYERQQAKPKSA